MAVAAMPPRHGEGEQRSWRSGGCQTALRLPVPGRILACLLLASCSGAEEGNRSVAAPDLERAAIARGLVRDPADRDVTGLYARDTDRVCVVPQGGRYRIGAFVDYGEGLSCAGAGTASRSGDTLAVELRGEDDVSCTFDANFDGERIVFPANVPEACRRLCGPRASFGALSVERLSESVAEATAMRDGAGNRLCGD